MILLLQQQTRLNGHNDPLDDVVGSNAKTPRAARRRVIGMKSPARSMACGPVDIHGDKLVIASTQNVRMYLTDAMGRPVDADVSLEATRISISGLSRGRPCRLPSRS